MFHLDIITILLNLMSALIGFWVGNRLAIDRDKRLEFNKLIEPIRRDLWGIRENPSSDLRGAWGVTMKLIRERLPIWKRKAFDRAIENYKNSKGENNRIPNGRGGFSYKDTTQIVHAANNLLKFLKPR